MTTRSFDRHAFKSIKAVITGSDLDLTAANQTAQAKMVGAVPSNAFVTSVHVVNSGSTITSSDVNFSAFNVTAGTSSGGTQYFSAVDLQTANTGNSVNTVIDVAQSQTVVYVGFAPAGDDGAGNNANWNEITTAAANISFTVTVLYVELDGDECR
jgi:hypothetical protein